jgi:predicted permease
MAAIVFILYMISTVSLEHVVWTAGGILLGLTAGSVYILKRRRRTNGDDKRND